MTILLDRCRDNRNHEPPHDVCETPHDWHCATPEAARACAVLDDCHWGTHSVPLCVVSEAAALLSSRVSSSDVFGQQRVAPVALLSGRRKWLLVTSDWLTPRGSECESEVRGMDPIHDGGGLTRLVFVFCLRWLALPPGEAATASVWAEVHTMCARRKGPRKKEKNSKRRRLQTNVQQQGGLATGQGVNRLHRAHYYWARRQDASG